MKRLLLIFLGILPIIAHAQDMTPVATIPVTQVGFQGVINPVLPFYFDYGSQKISTIRFIMDTAWFIEYESKSKSAVYFSEFLVLKFNMQKLGKIIFIDRCFSSYFRSDLLFDAVGYGHNYSGGHGYSIWQFKDFYTLNYRHKFSNTRTFPNLEPQNNAQRYSDMFFSME